MQIKRRWRNPNRKISPCAESEKVPLIDITEEWGEILQRVGAKLGKFRGQETYIVGGRPFSSQDIKALYERITS